MVEIVSPPTARDIQRWYPERFREFAGNTDPVQTSKDFIERGPANLLLTGPSRSGKTRLLALLTKALCCTSRTPTLDPCGTCPTCREVREVRRDHYGCFAGGTGSEYSFMVIDCASISKEQLLDLTTNRELENRYMLVLLDEFRALAKRNLADAMLKLVDESPATFFASCIATRGTIWRGRKPQIEGMPQELLGRFLMKGTSLPNEPDLKAWMVDRANDWQIEIVEPKLVLPFIVQQTAHRVGYVLHYFASAAATRNRQLTIDLAKSVKLTALD